MFYTKQNWIFYFVDHYSNKTITHKGLYTRPKSTKHWKKLELMPNEEVKTIGLELANEQEYINKIFENGNPIDVASITKEQGIKIQDLMNNRFYETLKTINADIFDKFGTEGYEIRCEIYDLCEQLKFK